MATTVEQLANEMFDMVKEYHGKKNFKAMDLTKAMRQAHDDVSKDDCKKAIRELMDTGRCIYSYVGGSYITLPPQG